MNPYEAEKKQGNELVKMIELVDRRKRQMKKREESFDKQLIKVQHISIRKLNTSFYVFLPFRFPLDDPCCGRVVIVDVLCSFKC